MGVRRLPIVCTTSNATEMGGFALIFSSLEGILKSILLNQAKGVAEEEIRFPLLWVAPHKCLLVLRELEHENFSRKLTQCACK